MYHVHLCGKLYEGDLGRHLGSYETIEECVDRATAALDVHEPADEVGVVVLEDNEAVTTFMLDADGQVVEGAV